MTLEITKFILGPLENNCYLIKDTESSQAVIIDPPFGSQHIIQYMEEHSCDLVALWITHAHFDHYAGAAPILKAVSRPVQVALHPDDLSLWEKGGEAAKFGIEIDLTFQPNLLLEDQQILMVGNHAFQVLHTPGHSRGHVVFYSAEAQSIFCGDVIFQQSIGRTDLLGGDHTTLIHSIRNKILTMPLHTKLYSGHGKETTIEEEMRLNPFLT